ncbi:MAG TPA: hypothetical protein VH542_09765 [Steroidobacteraceae bacterium]
MHAARQARRVELELADHAAQEMLEPRPIELLHLLYRGTEQAFDVFFRDLRHRKDHIAVSLCLLELGELWRARLLHLLKFLAHERGEFHAITLGARPSAARGRPGPGAALWRVRLPWSRIIKANFNTCRQVMAATRLAD